MGIVIPENTIKGGVADVEPEAKGVLVVKADEADCYDKRGQNDSGNDGNNDVGNDDGDNDDAEDDDAEDEVVAARTQLFPTAPQGIKKLLFSN